MRFSGAAGSKGNRPIVVSYASSPPAEVIFRDPRPTEAPTGVIEDSCFRQIEFAGVLRGARNEDGARELVDFMLSKRFQEDVPLQMFVFPATEDAAAPAGVRALRSRAREPARAGARGDRGEPRPVDPASGRTSSFAERSECGARSTTASRSRSWRCSSRTRSRRSSSADSARRTRASPLDVLTDPDTRESSGSRSGRRSRRRCSRSRSRCRRRTSSAASPSAAAAWSGRWSSCRSSFPRSSSRWRSSPCCRPASSAAGRDPRRARLLQRRGRRPRRRDVLGEPRPAPLRGRRDARRLAVAELLGRSRSRCSHPPSRPRPRSSSSSRSPRSGSSSSSAAPATPRSRRRSTTRRSGSSTCVPPPSSRSCSSSASRSPCGSR